MPKGRAVRRRVPRLSVAAYNGASTVLSGPGDDVEHVAAALLGSGDSLRVAGNQSRIPLRASRSRARRIRVVCKRNRLLAAAVDARLQSHRRGATRVDPASTLSTGDGMRASRSDSPKRGHARRAGLRGVDGARPATNSHRGGDAGLARHRTNAADHRITAPRHRCPTVA